MKTTHLVQARRFLRDTRGANLVEYVMLVGIVALFCVAAYKLFGDALDEQVRGHATQVGAIRSGENAAK